VLAGKHIALGVTGSIAAYKAVLILRALKQQGARVTVVMTQQAAAFIAPLTFEALSGEAVLVGSVCQKAPRLRHIDLAQQVDLLLVAPATANIIGKLARGVADDFLSTLYLALQSPTLIAPAMNKAMYTHPVVQENMKVLKRHGVGFIPAQEGKLACGAEGPGRLAEVEVIVERVIQCLTGRASLAGKKILVSAGPTREPIDQVRFISNPSSGKTGYAIAGEARARGAEVTLISGPVTLLPPGGVRFVGVTTAQEMHQAVLKHFKAADALIMAAAVADYTPAQALGGKLKKGAPGLCLELVPTTDILTQASKRKGDRLLIGFAAEVEQVVSNARKKLEQKGLDMIVANDVSRPGMGFGGDANAITIIDKQGRMEEYPLMSKAQIARIILDKIEKLWEQERSCPIGSKS
jgi:phosphopantothenoylcysteine decarboxylase/phosphopantothenate--cysteine ligase